MINKRSKKYAERYKRRFLFNAFITLSGAIIFYYGACILDMFLVLYGTMVIIIGFILEVQNRKHDKEK